ncbi:MAG: hypothetical protein M0R17_05715 [Candidatus Omnitrophica bacterium]|jgi:hypothetical protein|nr:hypothetical protein [Candidatus Omnitrophota bacterium]
MNLNKSIEKATRHHLDNIKILSEREPSKEELKEMYSYLDYCYVCGKEIRCWELISHSFEGNFHRFGCSLLLRILAFPIKFFIILIKVPIIIVIAPFYYLYYGIKILIKKLFKRDEKKREKIQ